MPTLPKRTKFFETETGQDVEEILRHMQSDAGFNTVGSYTPDTGTYPDHVLPFMEKHKQYLIAHPEIDPYAYVANLRLKTRIR